ncbi:MAG: acyl-CoA thioesterase [Deltaproteobacteria bacterium]|nr:acyl-CoA thioesterase [Deltaproteobacteria bacterium]
MKKYHFELDLRVRDYELDMLGMVNNSVYLNYLEHTRHEFLKTVGIHFDQMFEMDYRLVVTRYEIDYLRLLKSGDRFSVKLRFERKSRAQFLFLQDIYILPDQKPVLNAKVVGTCLSKNGRVKIPEILKKLFLDFETKG